MSLKSIIARLIGPQSRVLQTYEHPTAFYTRLHDLASRGRSIVGVDALRLVRLARQDYFEIRDSITHEYKELVESLRENIDDLEVENATLRAAWAGEEADARAHLRALKTADEAIEILHTLFAEAKVELTLSEDAVAKVRASIERRIETKGYKTEADRGAKAIPLTALISGTLAA